METKVIRDLHYGEKEIEEIDFALVCEPRNFLCKTCMRVVEGNLYVMILNDETGAICHLQAMPTMADPYMCPECKEKKKKKEDKNSIQINI